MTTYHDQYPDCATCPVLLERQAKLDALMGKIDEIKSQQSNRFNEDMLMVKGKQSRGIHGQLEYLDELSEDCAVPDPTILDEYEILHEAGDSLIDRRIQLWQRRQDAIERIRTLLIQEADLGTAELANNCRSPKQVGILGYKAIHCSSRSKDHLPDFPAWPVDE